jgi:hypothetical protein
LEDILNHQTAETFLMAVGLEAIALSEERKRTDSEEQENG